MAKRLRKDLSRLEEKHEENDGRQPDDETSHIRTRDGETKAFIVPIERYNCTLVDTKIKVYDSDRE